MENKLIVSLSPHVHGGDSVQKNMYGVLIALIPAFLVSLYFFGLGALIVTATSVAACLFFEWAIGKYLMKKPTTTICDGSAIITSSASSPFTQEDVVKMARQINSGSLPFALTVDSYSTISPSLGENSLSAMVLAGVIAFALIMVLMTALYRLPGFLACIALAGQVAATLAFVSGYFPVFESFTLTLPGIAGIILAIGMGVDANVITAERIKEELRSGKSLDGALKSGFARGLTPIIDGNVTIVIVAIVLMGAFGPSDGFFAKALHFVFFAFGPSTAGTIYAFGYTLLTGVLLNFVFGIFATRIMIRGAASIKALRDPRLYGADAPGKTPAERKQVNFVGMRKRFLTFSACLMAAIVLCAVVLGVHLDTEFTGGAMITLSYENSFEMSVVQKAASEALGSNGLTLQTGENVATGEQTLKISMPGTETVTTDEVQTLLDSLNESCPDNSFAQPSLSNVSAAMGTKFLQKSLVAVVFALVLILAYIAYRFKNIGGLTGGMMAVLALLNDLMVVFGTFVLLRVPLDGNFIAAMLTILGYSINDTVVVYDRIRENRGLLGKKAGFQELVNHSINQSARRTIITTGRQKWSKAGIDHYFAFGRTIEEDSEVEFLPTNVQSYPILDTRHIPVRRKHYLILGCDHTITINVTIFNITRHRLRT